MIAHAIARAVELQQGQPAQYHPGIDGEEDQDDCGFGYHGGQDYRLNAPAALAQGITVKRLA